MSDLAQHTLDLSSCLGIDKESSIEELLISFAGKIDQTFLTPKYGEDTFLPWVQSQAPYGFASLCVSPYLVPNALFELDRLHVETTACCSVINFPHGTSSVHACCAEATYLVEQGAQELDMVMNVGQFLEGHHGYVADSIVQTLTAAQERSRELGQTLIFKVIIETGMLNSHQIEEATRLLMSTGVHFVKTCTGFGPRGVSLLDIETIAPITQGKVGIKASGGITSLTDALALLHAGATRLGTSRGDVLVDELEQLLLANQQRDV